MTSLLASWGSLPCAAYEHAELPDACMIVRVLRSTGVSVIVLSWGGVGLAAQDEALMERAEWCRKYAQINAVALRKV